MNIKKETVYFTSIVILLSLLVDITGKFFYNIEKVGIITLIGSLIPAAVVFLLEKNFKLKDLFKDKLSLIYILYSILFITFYILSFFSEKVFNNIDYVVYLGWAVSLYILTIDNKVLKGKFNLGVLIKWAIVVIILDVFRLGIMGYYYTSEIDFNDLFSRVIGVFTVGLVSTISNFIFTMGEEYGWRYFLQTRLQSLFGKRRGVLITGFIWGLFHIPLYGLIFYNGLESVFASIEITIFCITFGIVLGLIYMESRSVIIVTFIHLMHNMFMANLLSTGSNQDFIFTKGFLIVSVLTSVIFYTPFLLNKKYN
ncbi:CPBP family intramembrane metalloprotease [Peptoniphilus sp. MSJ-1]|uniref:CPBP family intramembrane metalloprotease n=1 Tax=Peptoniphilus ovalis TaxID=2841503 RepID=A0ABS6FJ56_9FIRM|nr:type II CAAX endopeptidase family protein [Peptoniphilus ovalis]MBU5670039.1 CPBP family intramembrane metalloprotease [Peptoniphilus ovalis]